MHINNLHIKYILFIMLTTLASSCVSTPPVKSIPQGFAAYENIEKTRAVSPDGVMYRIREEKNKPYAELPFWREALKKRMLDAGYRFMSEDDIKAGERPGYLLELAAPLGARDFSYLIALFVNDNEQLVIVEAAGDMALFEKWRPEIIKAIEEIEI